MINAKTNSLTADSLRGSTGTNVEDRPKIGLALSSGGAKGLAHVGVIQVLEENGIPIDAVAGTSMGAYVGSLCAAGLSGKELEDLAAEITDKRTMLELVDPAIPPRRGFIHGKKIRKRLERTLGKKTFDDLEKPFFLIATATDTYSAVVLKSGRVSDAVHASIAIPGVFIPVKIDGREYVDGAISDPIPVEPLREAGMDIVIAVSVIPTSKEVMICELEANPPPENSGDEEETPKSKRLSKYFNYFAPGNVLDTLRRSVMGVQMRLAEIIAEQADVVIRPIHCSASFQDYSNFRALIDKGRETATEMLPEIKRVIEEQAKKHEVNQLPTA